MGSVLSGGKIFDSVQLSREAEQSLQQIIDALKADPSLWSHRSGRSSNNRTSTVPTNKNSQSNESNSLSNPIHRSRSADRLLTENLTRTFPSSSIPHQWQCQLCLMKNESDAQLCSECGSNKINVYIPLMNSNQRHRRPTDLKHSLSSSSSTSAPSNFSSINRREGQRLSNRMGHGESQEESNHRRSVLIAHKREADEQLVLDHVEKVLRTYRHNQSRFKDENFPASSTSLFINGHSFSKSTLAILPDQQTELNSSSSSKIIWLRPDQIEPEPWSENDRTEWTVFRDPPKPNDVLQGALGDCWFITALSVLAENPEYLKTILITKQYNREGIYCVRLCKDGEWTQVFVDDRLPCTRGKRLAYSQAHRKQLWVPLIEKALAKLNGSYEAIIAGRCCEGLATVTGSQCETLILGRSNNPDDKNVDHNKLWSKLFDARSQRFLMCAMCSNNLIRKDEFDKFGLLNIHAYSLQDVKQSPDGKHRLVKLRNPWGGTYRWTGDWSDNSRLWVENADLRRELLNEKQNQRDGVFWMPFHSFVKYFECVDICKLRNNWYEVRDTANFYPSARFMQAYKLSINTTTDLDFSLHRKIRKNLRIQRSEVSLCLAVINMEERSTGDYRIYSMPIISQRGQHKFISTDGQLQAGTYYILPLLFNPTNIYLDNTDFSLAIHSSHTIDLERVKFAMRIEREFLIKFCVFYGEQVRTANDHSERDAKTSDGVTVYELKQFWDGLILLVENRHPSKNVHFHFRCTVSDNAIISRKDSPLEVFDVIPPNYRQIIVSITRRNASHSFTIGHDFQYILSSQIYLKSPPASQMKHCPPIDETHSTDDIHRPQMISTAKTL